jgi:cell wall-associated NlpC family hydrolase
VQLEEALHIADVAMAMAQEEYTLKQWENVESQRQLFSANSRADESARALDAARGDLAVIAMASYREGGTLGSFEAIMTADGFEDVITRSEAIDRASDDAAVVVEEVRAAELVAQTMRRYAEEAAEVAIVAEQAAEDAYIAAKQAEADARQAYSEAEAARSEAVIRLAQLQRTSAQLANDRQAGLAAERAARAEAEAQLRAQLAALAAQQYGLTPAEAGDPNVTPFGGTSVGTAEQGQIAVLFAMSHIGDPYVLGSAGPSSWDCSGLTSTSWRTAGVYIPRTSKQQYAYVGKIPYEAMRPGDLIFWGYGAQADGVYHVTMYIGNNTIVESPKPGGYVKTRDYRNSWASADRLPFAGRP